MFQQPITKEDMQYLITLQDSDWHKGPCMCFVIQGDVDECCICNGCRQLEMHQLFYSGDFYPRTIYIRHGEGVLKFISTREVNILVPECHLEYVKAIQSLIHHEHEHSACGVVA